jgi:hypothetical protein
MLHSSDFSRRSARPSSRSYSIPANPGNSTAMSYISIALWPDYVSQRLRIRMHGRRSAQIRAVAGPTCGESTRKCAHSGFVAGRCRHLVSALQAGCWGVPPTAVMAASGSELAKTSGAQCRTRTEGEGLTSSAHSDQRRSIDQGSGPIRRSSVSALGKAGTRSLPHSIRRLSPASAAMRRVRTAGNARERE